MRRVRGKMRHVATALERYWRRSLTRPWGRTSHTTVDWDESEPIRCHAHQVSLADAEAPRRVAAVVEGELLPFSNWTS